LSRSHATSTSATATLSLHDALPISGGGEAVAHSRVWPSTGSPTAVLPPFNDLSSKPTNPSTPMVTRHTPMAEMVLHNSTPSACADRKSTRLNSSHVKISYAVFCLKK